MANTYENPQVAQQRALARALMEKGMNPQSVNGVYTRTNKAADIASALMGAANMWQADRRERADDEAFQKTVQSAVNVSDQPEGMVSPNVQKDYLLSVLAGNRRTAPIALEAALKQRLGGDGRENIPADIQVYEYLKRLPPEEQKKFADSRWRPSVLDFGNRFGLGMPSGSVNEFGGGSPPVSGQGSARGPAMPPPGAKTLKPNEDPNYIRDKVKAEEEAKAQATAANDLSRVEMNSDEMERLLDKMENSNLGLIYGASSVVPIIPGTPQADLFSDYEKLQGKAFLEAFGSLKGGGQITEVEGQKATAAITSLSQRKQRPESARAAIKELRRIAKNAAERARKKAKQPESNVTDWNDLP